MPYIPAGSQLFDDLDAVGGFVKNEQGDNYEIWGALSESDDRASSCCIDFTNPEAVRVYQDYLRRLFKLGVAVIKTDFGEEAPYDGVWCDGTAAHRMHNLYPLLYNRAVAEVTKEQTGACIVWARSAWAGSQRYPIHWGGDSSVNWESIIPQITGGLSLGLSGFPFWSHDIGGFMWAPSDPKLVIRWNQIGMFMSHSRNHGGGDRELYRYPDQVLKICRRYIRLRYRLLPYILAQARRCVATALPMLRPLVIEYQDDPNVWNLNDEYLFGEWLLVAPIVTPEDRRRVYLPEGVWSDWWTGERIDGGRWINVQADLETLPLYIREGAVIPMGPVMNYVNAKKTDRITLRISSFAGAGASELAVPVNDELVPVRYESAGGRHTVTIGASDVAFNVEFLGEGEVDVVRDSNSRF